MLPLVLAMVRPPLGQSVTFDEAAMPLARLLPALGAKAGVEIVAAGTVGKDVALVRVRDRPLGEVLQRLTQEDGVELESTERGFRLVRTGSSERKERAASLNGRIASLQAALEETREAIARPVNAATYRTLLPSLRSSREHDGHIVGITHSGSRSPVADTPATRAAMRGLLTLPPDLLADLREGDRIVYSNRPTRLQRALPALDEIARSFASEQTAWAAAVAKIGSVKPSDMMDDPFRYVEAPEGPPARIVMILNRGNSAAAAGVRMVLLDARGEALGTANYAILSKEAQRSVDAFQFPTKTEAVPTSPDTQTLIGGLPVRDAPLPREPSSDAVALVSHPEAHDPLSFGATDLLRDAAGERPLVAILPDEVWPVGLIVAGGLKRSWNAYLQLAIDLRVRDGWVVAHPRDPDFTRRTRVDRAVLGRFVRAVVAEGRVPLDAYAEYAWRASEAPSDRVGVLLATILSPGTSNPDADWRELRLFGSLSASDRKALLAGGKKTWETLSLPQRTLAEWIVEHHIRSMSFVGGEAAPPMALMMEPTEVFADGFDALEMTLAAKEDAPLLCDSTTKNVRIGWRRVIEPENVGDYLAMKDGPEFDRFAVARRTTYTLTLKAKRNASTSAALEDVIPPHAPLKPLADLPEPLRRAVERSREDAEKRKGDG